VRWTDRLAWWAYRAEEIARDEILRAWLEPNLRDVVIADAYEKQTGYLPGGNTYERGLFEWEAKMLDSDPFPTSGRILLGAAGGGRELRVLLERGFDVVAFEPNPALRAGAQNVADERRGRAVIDATYADLVRAAKTKTGPLAGAVAAPFAATILGWGSLTHVLTREDQRALLEAVRACCPSGPVLISFFLRAATNGGAKSDRLRSALRFAFKQLGGQSAPEGLTYEMNGGFVYSYTEEEIHELAFRAGYEVVHLAADPFPHALLLPAGRATA
jgi:hypothetical protein